MWLYHERNQSIFCKISQKLSAHNCKVRSKMNLTNLNDYIVSKICSTIINLVPLKLQILSAFWICASHFCAFTMWGTRAFFVKSVRNWNVPISSNFAIIWLNEDISISKILHKKCSGISHSKATKMWRTSPESWQNLQFQRHQNDYATLSKSGNMHI